eukprot:m.90515 g.90515  ORF g.90515 m.90515 type:complete len:99 (+) comp14602_c0_seq23:3683-3979(+)
MVIFSFPPTTFWINEEQHWCRNSHLQGWNKRKIGHRAIPGCKKNDVTTYEQGKKEGKKENREERKQGRKEKAKGDKEGRKKERANTYNHTYRHASIDR